MRCSWQATSVSVTGHADARRHVRCTCEGAAAGGGIARLDHCERVVAARHGSALDPRAPWGILVLAATLASASSGVVYDSGTLRLLPRWILENPLDGFMLGSIKNHVAILSSTDPGGMQLTTTLGLNKYSLFELELARIPAAVGSTGGLLAGLAVGGAGVLRRDPFSRCARVGNRMRARSGRTGSLHAATEVSRRHLLERAWNRRGGRRR
ncbi:MAG: hypothetical protein ACREM8_06860 [Vulcanimicrobiaceae bacterium]